MNLTPVPFRMTILVLGRFTAWRLRRVNSDSDVASRAALYGSDINQIVRRGSLQHSSRGREGRKEEEEKEGGRRAPNEMMVFQTKILNTPLTDTKIVLTRCHIVPSKCTIWYLILRKIIKFVGIGCQILRLKCTKFNFGPRPCWGAYSDPPPDPV